MTKNKFKIPTLKDLAENPKEVSKAIREMGGCQAVDLGHCYEFLISTEGRNKKVIRMEKELYHHLKNQGIKRPEYYVAGFKFSSTYS